VTSDAAAVIDCGSNSTRLLVVDRDGRVLTRRAKVTGLAAGLEKSGQLSTEAIERVRACAADYVEVANSMGAQRFRVLATAAAREASNRQALLDMLDSTVGASPELLSGLEEARLAFAGATGQLDPSAGPFLVADIGGGSTELAVGSEDVEGALSLDVGCVRLSDAYIEHDPPRPEELVACLSLTEAYLDEMAREYPLSFQAAQFVGAAGTVTAAAAVELGLLEYDSDQVHHFRLTREAVEDVFRTVATENREQRLANPGLEADRVDVFVAGMCILVKIMRFFDFEDCLVSEADLLDGAARALFE